MQTQVTVLGSTAGIDRTAAGRPQLTVGSQLIARTVSVPAAGGRGQITVAGLLLEAELPAGLAADQRLRLTVTRIERSRLVLQIQPEPEDASEPARAQPAPGATRDPATARLAGELAVRGDGQLLQAALGLAGGALPLPGGGLAEVTIDPDEADGEAKAGSGDARFVLHAPAGAIEVHLRSRGGTTRATVTAPPGAAAELARSRLDQLIEGLERATGGPAGATVAGRPAAVAPPRPPAGLVDERG
jgi:hypothetical protein